MDPKNPGSSSVQKKQEACSSKSDLQMNASTRLQRNQAEKQRRDRLNGYVAELATLVPMVKNASKPLDKVSILRLTAAHMRLNLSCLNPKNFKSDVPNLPSSVLSYLELVEKSLGGFVIVTTFTGLVVFCSKSIENYTGYHNIDIMGQPIFNYVHNKEVSFFERKIHSIVNQYEKRRMKKTTKMLKMHLRQRPLPRTNETKYQKMTFKLSIHSNENQVEEKDNKTIGKKKKTASKDFGASAVILMFIQPTVEPNISLLLVTQDVYYTIHGLQGEIMFADHRISPITGYLPHEVQGTNAYQYIFDSDVPIALFAQKAMFSSNDGMGLITYRLRIFGSKFIYLQSKGRIVYKESSTDISHFVCYNRCLSDEEGSKELKKFQERFAPQIDKAQTLDANENIRHCKSHHAKTSVSVASVSFPKSAINVLPCDPLQSSGLPLHIEGSFANKSTKIKKIRYSPNCPTLSEKQNLYTKPDRNSQLPLNVNDLPLSSKSSGKSFQAAIFKSQTDIAPFDNREEINVDVFGNDISPYLITTNETPVHSIVGPLCNDKIDNVNFVQMNGTAFSYSNSSSLNFKGECFEATSNHTGPLNGTCNIGLVKPIIHNADSYPLNNRLENQAPGSQVYNHISQEASKIFAGSSSFAYSNVLESDVPYNSEALDLLSTRCLVDRDYSSISPSSTSTPSGLDVQGNSRFMMDKRAEVNKLYNNSNLNELVDNRRHNPCIGLSNEECFFPCIQSDAHLSQQSLQQMDNLLINDFQNSGTLENISVNDSFSKCNGLNASDSMFSFKNQDILELSKPNAQPKRSIFSEHIEIERPLYLNEDSPMTPYPSKRKKIDHQDFNGELYNELDVFFAKLPTSASLPNECLLEHSPARDWSANEHTKSQNFSLESFINTISEQVDLTLLN